MAKLHFSVSSDYKEVIRLRQECEKLEEQLKKMDVNKSPDVAKALEAQLEKATRKIREYQEKYIKLKKIQDDIGKSNNTSDDVKKGTAALRSTNKWIEANTKAIIEADNQIKILKKDFNSLSADDKAGSAGTTKLRQIEQVVAKRMAEAESIRKTIKVQKDKIIQDRSEEGSITQLRKQLSLLIVDYDNMGRLRRESGAGKALLAQIKIVQDELNKAEQASGRFQRNVGNYSSAFNGLGMSIQQIARELPTLSMGANMFFLAISNNLPIFFDEVQRARKEYTAYIAELKKGNTEVQKVAPVWKQIASGIFSWNTALTVGVTLLTVYGKDIVEWVSGLFNAEKQLDATAEAQEKLNEAQSEGIKNAQSELLKLNLLRREAENETKSRNNRLKAVSELQKMYPNYLGNIDKEKILTGDVSNIYKTLANNILNTAKAKAQFEKATKSAQEAVELEETFRNLSKEGPLFNLFPDDDKAYIESIRNRIKLVEKEASIITENALLTGRQGDTSAQNKELIKLNEIINAYTKWQNKIKETEEIANNIDTSKLISDSSSNDVEKALKIQQKIADELLQLQATNQQREIDLMKEGTEKKIAQINFDYKKQIEAIKKQSEKWAKEQGGTLTAEQTIQISTAFANARKLREKDTTSIYKEEFEVAEKAMNDYLSKYGTYEEQRLAITKQYEEKIAKAITEGEKKTLQKEMENAISSIEFTKLKNDINWDSIFGNLSLYSSKKLKELRGQLRQLIETDKTLSMSDKTALIEQYNKLGDAIIKDQSALGKLFEHKTEQQKQIQLLKEEYELRKAIYDNLVKEQKIVKERYSGAKLNLEDFLEKNKFNTDTSSIDASKIISMLGVKGDSSSIDEFKYLFSMFNKAGNELSNVTSKVGEAGKSMQGASSALEGAGNSAASTISMIDMIIHGINDNIQSANELIKILEIEDTKFGEGFDSFAKSSQYATQAWESLKSGNIMGVAAGVAGSIKELGNAIGSWFGLSADYSSYNKMKEEYESLSNVWDILISKKQKYIDISYGDEARKIGNESIELLNKKLQSNIALGIERLNAGASAGSHSIGVRQRKNMSKQGWEELREAANLIGFKYDSVAGGRMTGLFDLTAKQLDELQSKAPTFWAKLDDDVREYLQNIIDCDNEIKKMKEDMKETMTGVSFDSFYDNFVSTLSDMDKSSQDFANDFGEYIKNAILSNLIANKYRQRIEDLYNDWAQKSDSNGDNVFDLTSTEAKELKDAQKSLAEEMIAERDALAKVFGWSSTSTQEASKKGFAQASQDSVDELNGRFTAGQVAWEETKNQSVLQNEKLSILDIKADSLINLASDQKNIADETRTILVNSYMELQQISENTGAIIKPITEMRDKMNSWDSKIRNM